ncbi:hypothetical protein AB3S75_046315 [Citrus x aurantiifolia]
MAPPQAPQRDRLARVGKEGFDLLDELYPKKHGGRLPPDEPCDVHHHARHQYSLYSGPQVTTVMKPVIDSNQAAQFFGAWQGSC